MQPSNQVTRTGSAQIAVFNVINKLATAVQDIQEDKTGDNNYSAKCMREIIIKPNQFIDIPADEDIIPLLQPICNYFLFLKHGTEPCRYALLISLKKHILRRTLQTQVETLIELFVQCIPKQDIQKATMLTSSKPLKENCFEKFQVVYTNNNPLNRIINIVSFVVEEQDQLLADAIANNQKNQLTQILTKQFYLQFETICMLPLSYKDTKFELLQKLEPYELKNYFRYNSTKVILDELAGKAMNLAYAIMKSAAHVTQKIVDLWVLHLANFIDPVFKYNLTNKLQYSEEIQSKWQQNLYRQFQNNNQVSKAVHPSPLLSLVEQHYRLTEFDCGVVDLFLMSSKYQHNMLRIANWIAHFILRHQDAHSESDLCALLLEGVAGSGKTTIADTLQEFLNGYKWIATSEYQNPSLAFKAIIHISDCDIGKNLLSPQMLKVLGFHESCMIQAKREHPIELTEKVPVIITSNNILREVFQKYNRDDKVYALCRRIQTVNFTEQFIDTYKLPEHLKTEFKYQDNTTLDINPLIKIAQSVQHLKKEAIINTLFGLALMFVPERWRVEIPFNLVTYFQHCFDCLQKTIFGSYVFNKFNNDEFKTAFKDQFKTDNDFKNPRTGIDLVAQLLSNDLTELQTEVILSNGPRAKEFYKSGNVPQLIKKCFVKKLWKNESPLSFEKFMTSFSNPNFLTIWYKQAIRNQSYFDMFDPSINGSLTKNVDQLSMPSSQRKRKANEPSEQLQQRMNNEQEEEKQGPVQNNCIFNIDDCLLQNDHIVMLDSPTNVKEFKVYENPLLEVNRQKEQLREEIRENTLGLQSVLQQYQVQANERVIAYNQIHDRRSRTRSQGNSDNSQLQ